MSDSRRILYCFSSYFKGNRFLERAKKEGCYVILVTVQKILHEPWAREFIDEVHALPTFDDRRSLVNAIAWLARDRKPYGFIALDDFDVEVVAFLRDHFCLPGLKESAAKLFRDKLAMRTKAVEIGIRVPEFTGIFYYDDLRHFMKHVPAPWLLKPRSQASAAGIRRLTEQDQLWQELDRLGDNQTHYLLERMVPGHVYHVDSLMVDNQPIFAEVNSYLRPLLEVYHDGGIFATRTLPRHLPIVARLKEENARLLSGFGLHRGASHTEFLESHADGSIYFIETSARVGGANISDMVEAATGINLWSEWAKLESDRDAEYTLPSFHEKFGGVVISLARQEWPDLSGYTDQEITFRLVQKHHIGFVVCSDSPERTLNLLTEYRDRIARENLAVLPAADHV